MKTAIFSVYHSGVKKYSLDFIKSLNSQTNLEFEVILLNDSDDSLDDIQKSLHVKSHIIKNASTIPKNREIGINYAKKNKFDNIIFLDFDDAMATNRVKLVKELLLDSDIVINQISTLTECKNNLLHIDEKTDLSEYNFCGFCNSAINLKNIEKVSFNDNLIAVDWYFFSLLKNKNFSIVFTQETKSKYRQHSLNTVGITPDIKRAIKVKAIHYKELSKIFPKYICYSNFFNKLNEDADLLEAYMKKVKNLTFQHFFWWQEAPYIKDFYEINELI